MVAPLVITIMLECRYCFEPGTNFVGRIWNSSAAKDARAYLIYNELIDLKLRGTPKGAAWVDALCGTPLPVAKGVEVPIDLLRKVINRLIDFRTLQDHRNSLEAEDFADSDFHDLDHKLENLMEGN